MRTKTQDVIPSPATLEGALNQGIAFHRDGSLENAERVYRSILDVAPDHADALNLLGPTRNASKGIAPPPAKGSTTRAMRSEEDKGLS